MTQPTSPQLATLIGANALLRDILNRYEDASKQARQTIGGNSNLSTEGKAAKLRQTQTELGQQYGGEVADLQRRVDTALAALQSKAVAMLPKPASGVEGLLGRQAQWSRARTLIDAGIPLASVIAGATDPEFLYSLDEEIPTAIQAGIVSCPGGADAADMAIDRRIAEVTSPAALAAHDVARQAEVEYAELGPAFQWAVAQVGGAPAAAGLTAAVAGQVARQLAAQRLRPIEDTTPNEA